MMFCDTNFTIIIESNDPYKNLIFRLDVAYILGSLKLNDTVNRV